MQRKWAKIEKLGSTVPMRGTDRGFTRVSMLACSLRVFGVGFFVVCVCCFFPPKPWISPVILILVL